MTSRKGPVSRPRSSGVTGIVCLAGSAVLLAATHGLPGPNLLVPVGPAFYPRIVLGITAVLSVALIVADLLAARRPRVPLAASSETVPIPPNYLLVGACFAVFGTYVAALPWLGFRISTVLFLVALQAVMDPPRDLKHWAVISIVAAATTVVAYFLFERYLLVLLPRGRWTDF